MKGKKSGFDGEALVKSVEAVRDAVTGRKKITLRTKTLPKRRDKR